MFYEAARDTPGSRYNSIKKIPYGQIRVPNSTFAILFSRDIDAYARCIVGWRVSRSAHADFVLDALDQALHDRRPMRQSGLIHHSDGGVKYVSSRYSARLAEAGIEPSVVSVGDPYDTALAETINGLYKTELIYRRCQWRSAEAVELATLD